MTDLAFDGSDLVRPRHRLLRIAFCLLVIAGLLVWGFLSLMSGIGKSVGTAVGRAITQEAADDAAQVSNMAAKAGVTPGFVPVERIQKALPTERWLPGDVAVTTGQSQVSLMATDDHVITATAESGVCFYGLSAGSATDPIVAADGLSGAGVYANSGGFVCSADQAPKSGWVKVSKSDLFHAGLTVDPGAG
jgi:hypothetical protein